MAPGNGDVDSYRQRLNWINGLLFVGRGVWRGGGRAGEERDLPGFGARVVKWILWTE